MVGGSYTVDKVRNVDGPVESKRHRRRESKINEADGGIYRRKVDVYERENTSVRC